MYFKKYNKSIKYLYHYTTVENAEKILSDKQINTGNNRFCFFTDSADKSRLLFAELMQKPINYVDDSLNIVRRIPQNPDDYVILKIRVKNDSAFYQFIIDTDEFNPYEYSIMHCGALKFEKAKILSISRENENTAKNNVRVFANRYKRAAAAGLAALVMGLGSAPAFAVTAPTGSWTDSGNYVTDWYDDANNSFRLTTAKQLAGLAVLANEGKDFYGKSVSLKNDIDLSSAKWVTIPSSFKGTIEGIDKVVLTLFSKDTPFAENTAKITKIDFKYANEPTTEVTYSVDPTYTVTIPSTVDLGETATISAENVVVEKGKQLVITLKGTSESDNSFKVKSEDGTELDYKIIKDDTDEVAVSQSVLTVNPIDGPNGSSKLTFVEPTDVKFAGSYTGTLTFTVSVNPVE